MDGSEQQGQAPQGAEQQEAAGLHPLTPQDAVYAQQARELVTRHPELAEPEYAQQAAATAGAYAHHMAGGEPGLTEMYAQDPALLELAHLANLGAGALYEEQQQPQQTPEEWAEQQADAIVDAAGGGHKVLPFG